MDKSLRESILRRDGYRCKACGKRPIDQVHYILAPGVGGPDAPMNLVVLCDCCQALINPPSVDRLLETLDISMREFLIQKARTEIAIHTWILETLDQRIPEYWRKRLTRGHARSRVKARKHKRIPAWKRLRPRAGTKWTPEDDEQLLQGFNAGLSIQEIAATLGRGEFSLEVRLWKLGRADLLPGKTVIHPDFDY